MGASGGARGARGRAGPGLLGGRRGGRGGVLGGTERPVRAAPPPRGDGHHHPHHGPFDKPGDDRDAYAYRLSIRLSIRLADGDPRGLAVTFALTETLGAAATTLHGAHDPVPRDPSAERQEQRA